MTTTTTTTTTAPRYRGGFDPTPTNDDRDEWRIVPYGTAIIDAFADAGIEDALPRFLETHHDLGEGWDGSLRYCAADYTMESVTSMAMIADPRDRADAPMAFGIFGGGWMPAMVYASAAAIVGMHEDEMIGIAERIDHRGAKGFSQRGLPRMPRRFGIAPTISERAVWLAAHAAAEAARDILRRLAAKGYHSEGAFLRVM
jgi:hypothetical protein